MSPSPFTRQVDFEYAHPFAFVLTAIGPALDRLVIKKTGLQVGLQANEHNSVQESSP